MVYWLGHAGGGDVTIKVWFAENGVLVLKRRPDAGGDFTPVAHNSAADPILVYDEPDTGPKVVPFEVDGVAASHGGQAQTLWHSAEQSGQLLAAVDDDLDPITISNGRIPLPPDCPDNQHEQRWFAVRFS